MYYKLDENKNAVPCTMEEWGNQRKDMHESDTKHVAEDTIGNFWISTVWLGINHNFNDNGKPLIFETMIFDKDHQEIYCNRYSTWQEAEEGHKAVVWAMNEGKVIGEVNE